MGELVDGAVSRAITGLLERDVDNGTIVIAEDAWVNELQREVRELCFTIILTQAPVARDLREIMGLLHLSAELERIGDRGVSIAKIGRSLIDLPELRTCIDLPKMAHFCCEQVRDILAAVLARDVDRARFGGGAGRSHRQDLPPRVRRIGAPHGGGYRERLSGHPPGLRRASPGADRRSGHQHR